MVKHLMAIVYSWTLGSSRQYRIIPPTINKTIRLAIPIWDWPVILVMVEKITGPSIAENFPKTF